MVNELLGTSLWTCPQGSPGSSQLGWGARGDVLQDVAKIKHSTLPRSRAKVIHKYGSHAINLLQSELKEGVKEPLFQLTSDILHLHFEYEFYNSL